MVQQQFIKGVLLNIALKNNPTQTWYVLKLFQLR